MALLHDLSWPDGGGAKETMLSSFVKSAITQTTPNHLNHHPHQASQPTSNPIDPIPHSPIPKTHIKPDPQSPNKRQAQIATVIKASHSKWIVDSSFGRSETDFVGKFSLQFIFVDAISKWNRPPFKELRILDLSYNGIAGWLGNEESNGFSNMSKLTQLNLRDNNFDKEILRSLGALPVLKSLDLSFNNMWSLSSKELVYLSNLEVLILQCCGLNGSLPFKDMANFSNLEILDLSGNDFTGSITPYIGALSSLKAISLSDNRLNGTLNTPEFCALKKLEEIDLAGNGFEGMLPPCLKNLTSLSSDLYKGLILDMVSALDLSFNKLTEFRSFS
ncbi:hypothetical protein CMV_016242 [Castanea mollissima]|uniref:Uncharacterized protein n=1 Tax=Castanea mollissima TaxID=60419 RepID=A0A8J4R7Z9_9ROSI|nr:hypothetical protein CMV_016242 [Castanea mollissima]